MASPENIDTDLTLELDGSEITLEKFRKGVNAFIGLLKAITKSVCRDVPPVEWRMQVKAGSLLVGTNAAADANPNHVRRILELMDQGLNQFGEAGVVSPVYPKAAIKHIRKLSSLTATKADDDTRVSLWVKRQRREITPITYSSAREALGTGFNENGTVEGQLSVLSERKSVHYVIYERVWDRPVTCTVPDNLLEVMMDLWRGRVAAHGMVHYSPDGVPTRIEADEIERFPDDDELPSHENVLGVLR